MACLDPDTVLRLLDGRVSATLAATVDDHIDGCTPCRRLFSEAAAGAIDEPADDDHLPDRLGPYEIRGLLGRGGMGEVYRAYDPRLDREVAVKVVRASPGLSAKDLAWFEREVRAAAAINHPNVMSVFDVGSHAGVPYVVTELLVGETVRARIRRGPVPARQAAAWARDIAHGMAAAHDRGIVHRDLKPENVFVTTDGRVKVLDFGVAVLVHAGAADDEVGEAGLVVGTIGYMAPEQLRGDPVDHRADVFAFGCVLYEMLSGRQAFAGGGDLATAEAALDQDPVERDPDALTDAPWPLVQVVRRCLEKSPAARFQSARDLAFALDMVGGDSARTARPPVRRRRAWPGLVGAAIAAAGVGVVAGRALRPVPPVRPPPTVTRLVDRLGQVPSARFAPDGAVYLGAAFDTRYELGGTFSLHLWRRAPDGVLTRVATDDDAAVVGAVSPVDGRIARLSVFLPPGTSEYRAAVSVVDAAGAEVARPSGGRADVIAVDFIPDRDRDGHDELAAIRALGDQFVVEAPLGTVRYQSKNPLVALRGSRGGELAVIERVTVGTTTTARVLRLGVAAGEPVQVGGEWRPATGVAWHGDQLLVSGTRAGGGNAVWRFDRGGTGKVVWAAPGTTVIEDVGAGGALLVRAVDESRRVIASAPGWPRPRDVSWGEDSGLADLSRDGGWIAMTTRRRDGRVAVIARRLDDDLDPTIVLDGHADLRFSPDSRRYAALAATPEGGFTVAELAAGSDLSAARHLVGFDPAVGRLVAFGWNKDALALVAPWDAGLMLFAQSTDGAPVPDGSGKPIAGGDPVAQVSWPDAADPANLAATLALDSSIDFRPGRVAGWSDDGKTVYVFDPTGWPGSIERFDVATEARTAGFVLPEIPPGAVLIEDARVAADGKTFAYSVLARWSELYRVDGTL